MPVSFDHVQIAQNRVGWRSRDRRLNSAVETEERFAASTGLDGGSCGYCGNAVRGVAWCSRYYILCLTCAETAFAAPNLRTMMPLLFQTPAEITDEDEPIPFRTKRDVDFDPNNYSSFTHASPLSGTNGCAGYRCPTFAAPQRTIPAGTRFMLGSDNRGHLCMACFQKLKEQYDAAPRRISCACCENYVRTEQTEQNIEGDPICVRCLSAYYMATPETDQGWVLRSSAAWVIVPEIDADHPARRMYASQQWAERNWFQGQARWYVSEAERDRELYSADEAYRNERITRHVSWAVFPYGTNVIRMHGFPEVTKRSDLCFGVELEMQPSAGHGLLHVTEILGGKFVAGRPFILCADSSLGSEGVELITLPYTLTNHKSDKYMPWTKILGDLRKVAKSGQNTQACGMHVHINRKALSHLQMGKMLVIINAPEMQELIVTIAQRSETSYARRFYKKVTEGGKIIGGHGDALNMSNNKGTCELRIFRGNLRYERVMKNLEFAEALCSYASEQSIQRIADPAEMFAWINDNRGHYPHLVKFLAEEYQPTKAFKRLAAKARKDGTQDPEAWARVAGNLLIEPTEGDI